jgi:hypothetical protein
MHAVYEKEKRGQPPYDPRLRTKSLVYGYWGKVFSSRSILKRLREDIPFRVLPAGNEPDFRTISDFRKIHIQTLPGLFEQVLGMALECGAIQLGQVSLNGTKLGSIASPPHAAAAEGPTRVDRMQAEAEDQSGQSCTRGAQVRGGTSIATDQTGARVSPILATRERESERRVGAGVPHTKYFTDSRSHAALTTGIGV